MRPKGSPKALEERRRRAMELLKQGLTLREVAEEVKSSASSVQRWKEKVKKEGLKSLKAQPHPHRHSQLSSAQRIQLVQLLLQGAQTHGWKDQLWTLKRIGTVIERHFGIHFGTTQIWRIMRQMGWSCQKPERRAREQNPQRVQEWRREDWPRTKRQARRGKKIHHLP